MTHWTDNQRGAEPRSKDKISPRTWAGIAVHIESLVSSGAFGQSFPEMCPDGKGLVGTNELAFTEALRAEIPNIEWPFQREALVDSKGHAEVQPFSPNTEDILYLIEFGSRHVAKPTHTDYHPFFQHYHLRFQKTSRSG